jgi:hypothetical protein
MNQFIYPGIRTLALIYCIFLFCDYKIYSREDGSGDFVVNPRIKSNYAFAGFEQIRSGNFNGYYYLGITRLNFSSIRPYKTLSFRHMAGISYNPAYNTAGLRLNSGISIFGICTRLNVAYHTNFKDQSVIIKPAIGIDLRFVTLTWGPNIILIHGLDKYFRKSNFCLELSGYW